MTTPLLECRDLSKRWDGGAPVLDQVSFDVVPGEWLSVIGPNGAGKSTLLHSIAGLITYDGSVRIDAAREPSPTDIALVPQKPLLPVGMTVAEYVLIGRTAHLGWLARESSSDRTLVATMLRRLGLSELAGREVASLSGGEAQRVVVARALVQQSPIVLLDEPTTALDIGHQTVVLEMLDDMRRSEGISVVAAMHDLTHAARFSDRMLLLDGGTVVALGTPAEVLVEDKLAAVYGDGIRVRSVDGELVVLPAARR